MSWLESLMGALGEASGQDEALKELEAALARPELEAALMEPLLARVCANPFACLPAYELLDRHIEAHPASPAGPFWRAWLLLRSVELGHDPDEADVFQAARRLLEQAEQRGMDPLALGELRGEVRRVRGKLDDARRFWSELLEKHPSPRLCHRLGKLELQAATPSLRTMDRELADWTGGRKAARAWFERGLILDPAHGPCLVGLARTQLDLKEPDAARATAAQARTAGFRSDDLDQLEVELERRFAAATSGPALTIEVLGLAASGEGWIEKGARPLSPAEDPAAAAEGYAVSFCGRLKLVEGSALVRAPDGSSWFFLVNGDGLTCEARRLDDPAGRREFEELFARQWAALEAEGAV